MTLSVNKMMAFIMSSISDKFFSNTLAAVTLAFVFRDRVRSCFPIFKTTVVTLSGMVSRV